MLQNDLILNNTYRIISVEKITDNYIIYSAENITNNLKCSIARVSTDIFNYDKSKILKSVSNNDNPKILDLFSIDEFTFIVQNPINRESSNNQTKKPNENKKSQLIMVLILLFLTIILSIIFIKIKPILSIIPMVLLTIDIFLFHTWNLSSTILKMKKKNTETSFEVIKSITIINTDDTI